MNLMGIFDSPTMPRPVKAMTGENVEAIKKVLQDNGLLGKAFPGTRSLGLKRVERDPLGQRPTAFTPTSGTRETFTKLRR